MPQAIGALIIPFIATPAIVGAIGFTGVAALALGIGYGVTFAALYGLSALLSSSRSGTAQVSKPEDGKINLKQPVPSLPYVLGRVRKASDYVLFEQAGGSAYHILVWAGHRINGYLEHRFHDEVLTIDSDGYVIAPAHFVAAGANKQQLITRDGLDAETAYSQVVAAFPSVWTDDHRGDGLASVMYSIDTVVAEDHQNVYPNQMPAHTAEGEGLLLYDPRDSSHDPNDDSTWEFTTNLALHRLWHLTHPVGGKLSISDLYLEEWKTAANVCDETVVNRDGQSESRYHGGFWFRADDDPVEVGRIIDQAAELLVYERADGLVGVHAGTYTEPDIRLTEDDIIAVKFVANRSLAKNVVAVRGKYTDTTNGLYTTVDAAPFGDPYSEDPQRTRTVENQAVQSHNHMARLEKITYTRVNAPRVTIVATYQSAKNVPFKRFVSVHYPSRLNEAVLEVIGRPKLSLRNLTIEFQAIVVSSSLYDFNAATDEGVPASDIVEVGRSGVPTPVNFSVTIQNEIISGGTTAAYGEGTWDFVSDSFTYEMEYVRTSGGTSHSVISTSGDTSVRSTYLVDGEEYQFRLRTWSGGRSSDWTDYEILTASADPVAPAVAENVMGTGGVGTFQFDWTAPNSSNYFAARLYLGTTPDFGSATLVATEYGAANDTETRIFDSLAANTYYGWVVSINASGVAATEVGTGSVVVS